MKAEVHSCVHHGFIRALVMITMANIMAKAMATAPNNLLKDISGNSTYGVGKSSCNACGYSCDANCNCGHCNMKPGCMTRDQCLGPCNGGGNAKWCGPPPPPPPPPPPTPPFPHTSTWSTHQNRLMRNGIPVVIHGMGTSCTEYLLRGIGEKCFCTYNWANASAIFVLDDASIDPLINYLTAIESDDVVAAVRIPMTASYWLGVSTNAAGPNFAKYPKLGQQYQNFITALVDRYTGYGIVTILDLHWSSDDSENAPMAMKGGSISAVQFWEEVAAKFGGNSLVFYELYNEPHIGNFTTYASGDDEYAGMLEMLAAVRKSSKQPVIIGGAGGYAYDVSSLVQLDLQLVQQNESGVIYNFHPYMGPVQSGDNKKCPVNFTGYLEELFNGTAKPAIITEFGQACCPTDGPCESCPAYNHAGETMGYDSAILSIATERSVSWLPWTWRPMASGPNLKTCEDINGGPNLTLSIAPGGNGGNFSKLWAEFATATN